MSNWLKAHCSIENIEDEFLVPALARMGLVADFTTNKVGNRYIEDDRPCDALLRNIEDNSSSGIGLCFQVNQNDNGRTKITMSAISDWWESEYTDKTFMDRFIIEYNTERAICSAREQGFTVEVEETLEDGRRRLVLHRAA